MDKYGYGINTKKTLEQEILNSWAIYSIKRELKITYKALAQIMGVSDRTLERWKKGEYIPLSAQRTIKLLWEIKKSNSNYIIENMLENMQN